MNEDIYCEAVGLIPRRLRRVQIVFRWSRPRAATLALIIHLGNYGARDVFWRDTGLGVRTDTP